MIAAFKAMKHDQAIREAIFKRPERFLAQNRDIWCAMWPGHDPLRSGHQGHDTAGLLGKRTQDGNGKPKTHHRFVCNIRPKSGDLFEQRRLGRAPQLATVVKGLEFLHVAMHVSRPRYRVGFLRP